MKPAILITVCLFLGWLPLSAQPDTIKVGAFLTDLYDINLSEKSFNVDFWIWFNYANPEKTPMATMELPYAKEYSYSLDFVEEVDSIMWATQKVRAIIKKDWAINNFPFDVQEMTIVVEESDDDLADLVYVADTENTKYDSRIELPNWDVVDFGVRTENVQYATTYGDPGLQGSSTYTRATFFMKIKRHSMGLFLTLFTGVYVAFFISVLVFLIDPVDVDPRFGLSVGGMFAAVGNKYIVDSILPQSTTFTLVDKIHILTYLFILVCIIVSVFSLRLWKNGDIDKSKRLDRSLFWILIISFTAFNFIFIYNAQS